MATIANHKVLDALAVSGTDTYYSAKTSLKMMDVASYHIVWSGTPTGTFSVWISNVPEPTTANDTDWVELTLAIAITQPAGSAGKEYVDLTGLPFAWVRLKYVNASGSGTVTVHFNGKGD